MQLLVKMLRKGLDQVEITYITCSALFNTKSLQLLVEMQRKGLERVALPCGLQSFTSALIFNQSLKKVALPSGLLSFTFGLIFNQSWGKGGSAKRPAEIDLWHELETRAWKVARPSGLRNSTFGQGFYQCRPRFCPKLFPTGPFSVRVSKTIKGIRPWVFWRLCSRLRFCIMPSVAECHFPLSRH